MRNALALDNKRAKLGPLAVFLYWRNYVARHPKRDWPDVTGQWPIPLWIPQLEDRIAAVEHEARAIAKAYAKNTIGSPPMQA